MALILVVDSRYSTTISEGGSWGLVSYGLYMIPTKVFTCWALLAPALHRRRGNSQLQNRSVELPRLASLKGFFAAYYARSIEELSGHTTGRLGYDRQDSAYAIGGTAELALRYSN